MPGRAGKLKGGKQKVEKKEKKEKIPPVVVPIIVNTPDGRQVELKGISTDVLLDVRHYLIQHVDTTHLTNYSFSHEIRGDRLPDTLELLALRPCVLDMVEEDYTEKQAVAHVRRLLDIVACTTMFGPSSQQSKPASGTVNGVSEGAVNGVVSGPVKEESPDGNSQETASQPEMNELSNGEEARDSPAENEAPKGLGFGLGRKEAVNGVVKQGVKGKGKLKGKGDAMKAMAAAEAAVKRGDREGMYPPSRLGTFYEFLSIAHLQSPLQSIKRSSKQPSPENRAEGEYFTIDVRLCNGKLVTVTASKRGFYPTGKPSAKEHELLDVLRKQSGAFTQAYDDLIQGFLDRNQFGNIPTGFRANSFVVPPPFAQNPSSPQALPVEDELWGGNGGGGGLEVSEREGRPWKALFQKLQREPCGTPEERIVRDRKAFLLHNLFVDVAVRTAIEVVQDSDLTSKMDSPFVDGFKTLHETECHSLKVTIRKEEALAGGKRGISNSGPFVVRDDVSEGALKPLDDYVAGDAILRENLDKKNVLKGLVADESTALADLPTLGMVTVYYHGLTVVVSALGESDCEEGLEDGFEVEQLDGGENALNVNSLRVLLHKKPVEMQPSEADSLLQSLLETGQRTLEAESQSEDPILRWELGACWIQHLQDEKKKAEEDQKKLAEEKEERIANGEPIEESQVELVHVGQRKGFKVEARPLRKGEDVQQPESKGESDEEKMQREKNESALKALLNDVAWKKVCDSKTGLHSKSIDELVTEARTFRNETALPKLVTDFASLELSPVDGRTLTDFMHTRGLNMNQLGDLAKKAQDLPHIREMCIMEMETRAFKRILKAVIAACPKVSSLASVLASALSAFLGEGPLAAVTWQWVEKFVELHYGYKLPENARSRLRKLEVLRGLCHKVGIEIAPRNYDLASERPFLAADVISMVPVYKSVACTTADGRQLLEQSKLALDKGKLDESVQSGCKALSKIIAVCGPRHRMTAGAYSLLAVVLYHTGDFNQATIYQQKALDINERELGLDHPDTMKSFGDLAVFYYRLQHTELALKYVHRALYLLNLICGSEHPNSAATYINVAMMEEGMGNVPIALRYLHEALKCNERLLGADHIQTAAAYHALAIVLSLMEAYSLSVQHEETTFRILTEKLGPDDLKTQDAAAWLDYFDSKAIEQQEVARTGGRKPDATIASKGHLSVDDLLNFINKEADQKEGAHKRAKRPPQPIYQRFRASVNAKPASVSEALEASSSESETESEAVTSEEEKVTSEKEESDVTPPERPQAVAVPDDDEGEWQEATPRSKPQKVAHSSTPPTWGRAFSPRGQSATNRGANPAHQGRGGFVRDVANRFSRSKPESSADVAPQHRGTKPEGLRLPGARPGYKPGLKNSHSPRSVLPSQQFKHPLRLLKPTQLEKGLVEPPKDGILAKPVEETPLKNVEKSAKEPTKEDAESGKSGEAPKLAPTKSWSFKEIVLAKPRKSVPSAEKANPVTIKPQEIEECKKVVDERAPEKEEASKASDLEVGSSKEVGFSIALAEINGSKKEADVADEQSEPSVPTPEQSEPSIAVSVTTSERSDSPALSESSGSQRSIPLTPLCKKSEVSSPPAEQISIPIPLPGPAVVPVTPVRRSPPPPLAQIPPLGGVSQYAYPPLLPTPQFRMHYPPPNFQYQNVNGIHMPFPSPPPQTYPQFTPPQWSPKPFRPNPLAVEFKPSGSPPLQNANSPSQTLNPGAAAFVPKALVSPSKASAKEETAKASEEKVEESVEEIEESPEKGAVDSSPVDNFEPKREELSESKERESKIETVPERKQEESESEGAVSDEEAPDSPKEAAAEEAVSQHHNVDDVSAAVLLDAKAAAEAAIKAALAKGGSDNYGSLGGLKLSADAAPFHPSAAHMSRTKSCGSLSQEGERDMVSVSVR